MLSVGRHEIRKILNVCNKIKCNLKILLGVYEIIDGKVDIKNIRAIEIEDLLGRDPVGVDLRKYLSGNQFLTV